MLFKDTAPEAVDVPERRQRLHVYDRLYRGDLHVLLVYSKVRLDSNVERILHSQHILCSNGCESGNWQLSHAAFTPTLSLITHFTLLSFDQSYVSFSTCFLGAHTSNFDCSLTPPPQTMGLPLLFKNVAHHFTTSARTVTTSTTPARTTSFYRNSRT